MHSELRMYVLRSMYYLLSPPPRCIMSMMAPMDDTFGSNTIKQTRSKSSIQSRPTNEPRTSPPALGKERPRAGHKIKRRSVQIDRIVSCVLIGFCQLYDSQSSSSVEGGQHKKKVCISPHHVHGWAINCGAAAVCRRLSTQKKHEKMDNWHYVYGQINCSTAVSAAEGTEQKTKGAGVLHIHTHTYPPTSRKNIIGMDR